MGEILQFPGEEERKIAALEEISREAINTVIRRYGDGREDSDLEPSIEALPYHNGSHTLSVVRHADEMARAMMLSDYDRMLALTAASAHDIDHTSDQGQAELESARWLGEMMRRQLSPRVIYGR